MKYIRVFKEQIFETPLAEHVPAGVVFVCQADPALCLVLRLEKSSSNVRFYISTKSMKHAYDRRPQFTTDSIHDVYTALKNPLAILKNSPNKRGDFVFVAQSNARAGKFIACPVEVVTINGTQALMCVTFFPAKSMSYFAKFPTLWDREVGEDPPS